MSSEDWNIEYHRTKTLNLKTVISTTSIIAMLQLGLTIAECIAIYVTFPKSSKTVEIDGVNFWIDIQVERNHIDWSEYYYFKVILFNDNDGVFPENVTAS